MSIHPFFNVLANEIGRAVAHAFKAKHKRDIDVEMLLVPDGQGNRRPEFRFQMAQPGLLPTALEREFFAGAVAGYRTCINVAMEVDEEFPSLRPPLIWRPEVQAFATLMEQRLQANDHKPGWKQDYPDDLWRRAQEELQELGAAITYPTTVENIGFEAADVANFAMMIADVCGALGGQDGTEPQDTAK